MNRYLLLFALLFLVSATNAQQSVNNSYAIAKKPQVLHANQYHEGQSVYNPASYSATGYQPANSGSRSISGNWIGSSSNLYTNLNKGTTQMYADDSLQMVTFIHRTDTSVFNTNNNGQYRFDISKDGGSTWNTNVGVITPNANNSDSAGRFPQAVVYNPNSGNPADSAYLGYSGSWLNYNPNQTGSSNAFWHGELRGAAQASGLSSTFKSKFDYINNGHTLIAEGLCKGQPGVFWNVNIDYNEPTNINGGIDETYSNLLIEKGVWNPSTNNVDWSVSATLPLNFALQVRTDASGNPTSDNITSIGDYNIAFDPTGQYGWIMVIGNTDLSGNTIANNPVFFKTTDYGATWQGPIIVNIPTFSAITTKLPLLFWDGTVTTAVHPGFTHASLIGESDLAVDYLGNPHALVFATFDSLGSILLRTDRPAFDLFYNATADSACRWSANRLGVIRCPFGGQIGITPPTGGGAATPTNEDTRPYISRTKDGKKLFFIWTDTDTLASCFKTVSPFEPTNNAPNLFGIGYDVLTNKLTALKNFTGGDPLWGGVKTGNAAGTYGGAILPIVSPIALTVTTGGSYNIPTAFTELDWHNTNRAVTQLADVNAARFYYANNINFSNTDFTVIIADSVPPIITLIGSDTLLVLKYTHVTDPGATACDLVSGNLTGSIHTLSTVDSSHVGFYTIRYTVMDAAGNWDTVYRTVEVGAPPVAAFSKLQLSGPVCKFRFTDSSLNYPTSWTWDFGDHTAQSLAQIVSSHTYSTGGTHAVKLVVSNPFGKDSITINIVCTNGINEVDFANSITMFPNPTTGKVTVSFESAQHSDVNISVQNALGEIVKEKTQYSILGNNNVEMNLSNLSSGIYFVRIDSKEGTVVKRLTLSGNK